MTKLPNQITQLKELLNDIETLGSFEYAKNKYAIIDISDSNDYLIGIHVNHNLKLTRLYIHKKAVNNLSLKE